MCLNNFFKYLHLSSEKKSTNPPHQVFLTKQVKFSHINPDVYFPPFLHKFEIPLQCQTQKTRRCFKNTKTLKQKQSNSPPLIKNAVRNEGFGPNPAEADAVPRHVNKFLETKIKMSACNSAYEKYKVYKPHHRV